MTTKRHFSGCCVCHSLLIFIFACLLVYQFLSSLVQKKWVYVVTPSRRRPRLCRNIIWRRYINWRRQLQLCMSRDWFWELKPCQLLRKLGANFSNICGNKALGWSLSSLFLFVWYTIFISVWMLSEWSVSASIVSARRACASCVGRADERQLTAWTGYLCTMWANQFHLLFDLTRDSLSW